MRPADAFATLGVPARFDIGEREVRAAWMRRAAAAHPDGSGAVDESAALNEARAICADPVRRAFALLELRGAPAVDVRAMPQEFLLEMMELRERADACAGDPTATAELRGEAAARRDAALGEIASLLDGAEAQAIDEACARRVVGAINVVRAFERMIEQLDREEAGGSGAAP
jgi:hypothetical protein